MRRVVTGWHWMLLVLMLLLLVLLLVVISRMMEQWLGRDGWIEMQRCGMIFLY